MNRLFLFLFFAFCFSVPVFSQWETEAEIFSFTASEEGVVAWENPAPEKVQISFRDGAICFRFLQPFRERVKILGPAVEIPAVDESVVKRILPLKIQGATPEMFDGVVAVSLVTPDGRPYASVAGNRDFQTAAVFHGAQCREGVKNSEKHGCKLGGTHGAKARILIDFVVPDGLGEFWLESLAFTQKTTVEHRISSPVQGNTFFEESGEISVKWAFPDRLERAVLTVTDEEQRIVSRVEVKPETLESTLKLEKRGFYAISAEAWYTDGRKLVTSATAAVVGPAISEELRQNSRFGLMLCHMSHDFAKKLGSRWNSGAYTFGGIQQNPDGSLVGPNGVTLTSGEATPRPKREILRIDSTTGSLPFWLRRPDTPPNGLYPPNDWEKLAECAELWAKSCPELPDVIGPYHEVNGAWKGNFDDLIKYHNVVSHAFKKARPDVPNAGPVFCNIEPEYFERCVKAGILKENDGVNIHPYVNGTAPEEDFLSRILAMKRILAENGYGALPIYFTEFGWSSFDGDWQKPVDSLTRARYCARSLILCTALNIRAAIYFAGRFDEPVDVEHYWLVKSNYTPYPALSAYATAVKELIAVPDGGRFARLAPDLFGGFFTREGKDLLVLWTRDGTETDVSLPTLPTRMRSMTGTTLELRQVVHVTPSPIYVELPSNDFQSFDLPEKQTLLPGNRIQVPGELLLAPGFVNAGNSPEKGIEFLADTPLGPYSIVSRTEEGKVTIQEVELVTPMEAEFKEFRWDGISPEVTLCFQARSCVKGPVSGTLQLILPEKEAFSEKISVPFRVTEDSSEVCVNVPASNGERLAGKVVFHLTEPLERTLEVPFETTPLVIPFLKNGKLEAEKVTSDWIDWEKIPTIQVEKWVQTGELRPSETSPATAEMKLAADEKALYIRLMVHDAAHVQKAASWSFMNQGDSLRLGFDFDAEQPWEFNNLFKGFNGHRVVEYGISLDEKGKHQWWNNRCWIEGMKSGPAFNLIPGTKIARDESAKTTSYDLTFLWKDLGSTEPPKPGQKIGFSLLILDKNPDACMTYIPFGNGLKAGLKPLELGRIQLGKDD